MIKICLCNQSTLFKDADLPSLANALAVQTRRDFLPIWGIQCQLFYAPVGKMPPKDYWVLALLDDSSQADALGFHDVTPEGLPLGKVFVRDTLASGDLVSVTTSHELLEMLGDPQINICVEEDDKTGRPSKFWSYENCDACEMDVDGYDVTIPMGWPDAGKVVRVSDFVTPNYFRPGDIGPYDFMQHLKAPLTLRPGGYMSYLDLGNLSAGWQQTFASGTSTARKAAARPRPGSRRSRRKLARSVWLQSVYVPGGDVVETENVRA